MRFETNADLTSANTLRLPSVARLLARPQTLDDVVDVLARSRAEQCPVRVLGEGSNVVMASGIDALVLKPGNRGVECIEDNAESVLLEVQAGENWDSLVHHCVEHGWHGLENLSLIPGSVGAAPFQNIGAYGVELSDCLESLDAVSLESGEVQQFSREQCGFGYRDSVFKSAQAGRWLIWAVRLRLQKIFRPQLGYGELQKRFEALPAERRSATGLRQLIISVRQEKLPDPAQLPTHDACK